MSLIGKHIIFSSGDICRVCNCQVWYFDNQPYERNEQTYVLCPTCNNEIQIIE